MTKKKKATSAASPGSAMIQSVPPWMYLHAEDTVHRRRSRERERTTHTSPAPPSPPDASASSCAPIPVPRGERARRRRAEIIGLQSSCSVASRNSDGFGLVVASGVGKKARRTAAQGMQSIGSVSAAAMMRRFLDGQEAGGSGSPPMRGLWGTVECGVDDRCCRAVGNYSRTSSSVPAQRRDTPSIPRCLFSYELIIGSVTRC